MLSNARLRQAAGRKEGIFLFDKFLQHLMVFIECQLLGYEKMNKQVGEPSYLVIVVALKYGTF